MLQGCFSGGASWKHNKHDPAGRSAAREAQRGAGLGTHRVPCTAPGLPQGQGQGPFVAQAVSVGGMQKWRLSPASSRPTCASFRAPDVGTGGTRDIRDPSSLASDTSRGHSTKRCQAGLLLCATGPDKAGPGDSREATASPAFKGTLSFGLFGGIPKGIPKVLSLLCCPAGMKDGSLHPSAASTCPQGTAGGNFQEGKKPPSIIRTWTAVPPPSASVPPFLRLLLPGSVLLCLPSPPASPAALPVTGSRGQRRMGVTRELQRDRR